MSRFAFLLLCLTFVYAEDDCVCDDYTPDEKNEIWNFLKKYPEGAEDEGVLAGILSPLVPCGNCIEYDRKKRTILPSTADQEDIDSNVIENHGSEEEPQDSSPEQQDPRCPVGYNRIGYRCIHIDDIY